jgi:hypothetical protein
LGTVLLDRLAASGTAILLNCHSASRAVIALNGRPLPASGDQVQVRLAFTAVRRTQDQDRKNSQVIIPEITRQPGIQQKTIGALAGSQFFDQPLEFTRLDLIGITGINRPQLRQHKIDIRFPARLGVGGTDQKQAQQKG